MKRDGPISPTFTRLTLVRRAPAARRRPLNARLLPVLALALAFLSGCATTSVRGIVRDADGHPVAGAVLAVENAGGAPARKPAMSETNGCFSFNVKEGQTLMLVVSAPGRREAKAAVGTKKGPPLLVTLQGAASGAESTIREVAPGERRLVFERYCEPNESDAVR